MIADPAPRGLQARDDNRWYLADRGRRQHLCKALKTLMRGKQAPTHLYEIDRNRSQIETQRHARHIGKLIRSVSCPIHLCQLRCKRLAVSALERLLQRSDTINDLGG